ncbi:MAG: hypothetical protein AB1649_03400 [Chloroflexota bacterium]
MATLNQKQQRAIAVLMSTNTVRQAAIIVGVGERTLHRWLAEDEEFRAALRKAELTAIDTATRRLIGSDEAAISKLLTILNSPTGKNSDKIKAARSLLEFSTRMIEARDVEERLSRLEALINANKQNP